MEKIVITGEIKTWEKFMYCFNLFQDGESECGKMLLNNYPAQFNFALIFCKTLMDKNKTKDLPFEYKDTTIKNAFNIIKNGFSIKNGFGQQGTINYPYYYQIPNGIGRKSSIYDGGAWVTGTEFVQCT